MKVWNNVLNFIPYQFRRSFSLGDLSVTLAEMYNGKKFGFRDCLHFLGANDGWMIPASDTLGRAIMKGRISLYELRQCVVALELIQVRDDFKRVDEDFSTDELQSVLAKFQAAYLSAKRETEIRQEHDGLLAESDLGTKQMNIAFWSAIGSVASAVAAFLAAIVTYVNH